MSLSLHLKPIHQLRCAVAEPSECGSVLVDDARRASGANRYGKCCRFVCRSETFDGVAVVRNVSVRAFAPWKEVSYVLECQIGQAAMANGFFYIDSRYCTTRDLLVRLLCLITCDVVFALS